MKKVELMQIYQELFNVNMGKAMHLVDASIHHVRSMAICDEETAVTALLLAEEERLVGIMTQLAKIEILTRLNEYESAKNKCVTEVARVYWQKCINEMNNHLSQIRF